MPIALRLTPLRYVWCSWSRACLFCYTRSLNPHPWLLLPPKTPNRLYHFLSGGSRHSLFLLACWSLRANRAVTVFASFSSLVPTLSIVCAVCSSFASPHSSVMLIRSTQHPFFIPGQEPSFALSLRSVTFILPLSNPLPSLLHAIPSYRISPTSSSIPPQTAILYTPLHVIAHSGTCLSPHKLRLQKTAPALPHAAAFRCPHFVAGFLLPAPSLHSLTARASPFGFAKKSTPLRSAAFSLAFGWLKAALPILLIIVKST